MTETKWDARKTPSTRSWFIVNSDTGGLICECDYENHAHLIAAAPELFDACESICGVFEGEEDVPRYVKKARAALARAGGQ